MRKKVSRHICAMLLIVGLLASLAVAGGGCLCAEQSPVPSGVSSPPPQAATTGSSLLTETAFSATDVQPSPAATLFLPLVVRQRVVGYGVVYPYGGSWSEADRPAIRERLSYLRELGVGVVVQVFSSRLVDTGQEQDWLIFLDEAQAQDIRVIARLWPPYDWDGAQFDFQYVERFLDVVQGHPALLAYFGLHEPLETFSGDQLRAYYQSVKGYAPDVPIFHAMSDIAGFEADPRFGDRRFTDGICDLCAIWYYPFRLQNGEPVFEEQRVRDVAAANDALVRERDPDAQIWFLAQAYALADYPSPLRMPSAQEMQALAGLLLEDPHIDGLIWYPWGHGSYDQVLGDPASDAQQRAVRIVYEQYWEDAADLPQ
ncbi:MAG: hypothetical protein JXA14_09985 [Anaerolineae bacterium]|nr:hypothetical protein [Anaerolineae bacterium]